MSGLFSVIILLLSATTAFAAPTQIAFSPDRVAGLIAGVVLLATFSYAFAIVTGPALRSATTLWALAALLLILVIKLLVLPFLPGLGIDVGTYQAWAIRMAEVGPARMYEPGYFVDYPQATCTCSGPQAALFMASLPRAQQPA